MFLVGSKGAFRARQEHMLLKLRAHQNHVLLELKAHQKHVLLELRAQQIPHIESKVVILAIFTRVTAYKVQLLYL